MTRNFGDRWALTTNLWPTARNRRDRDALGAWYVCAHLGPWRLEASHLFRPAPAVTVGDRGVW